MKAAEFAAAAVRSRAAYVAAAEAVARGERDAPVPEVLARLASETARLEQEARRQAQRDTWSEWRPPYAPHVLGRWTQRVFDDDGLPEEQKVVVRCEFPGCGGVFERACTSGLVQQHVQRFAIVHLHRDVLYVRPRKVEG